MGPHDERNHHAANLPVVGSVLARNAGDHLTDMRHKKNTHTDARTRIERLLTLLLYSSRRMFVEQENRHKLQVCFSPHRA